MCNIFYISFSFLYITKVCLLFSTIVSENKQKLFPSQLPLAVNYLKMSKHSHSSKRKMLAY